MSLKTKLISLINKTTLEVSDKQIDLLIQYIELMHKWNRAYNLTSIRNPEDMLVKHIMDSLMVGPCLEGKRFIDVGTGPGLPGIPLAILYPERHFVLLDSLGKRVTFLNQAAYLLKLDNVEPIKSRVEEYQPSPLFDGVLSRAFSSLNDMVSWCHHLVDNDSGKFFALKGQYPQDEIDLLPVNIKMLHSHKIAVPELDAERHLIELIKKT